MKPLLGLSLAASLALFSAQAAEACRINTPFIPQDIAFADVIFEGRVTNIAAKPRYAELTFAVENVVRGEWQENEIVIGWKDQYYNGTREFSAEEMKYTFGETTRVAVSTPKLANLFCESKLVKGKRLDEQSGEVIEGESLQPVCDASIESLVPAARENLPFVVLNRWLCGSTYLYPVERYEKMRDYDKNVAAFEKVVAEGLTPTREMVDRVIGPGPLPWKVSGTTPEFIAIDLYREQEKFFTPFLRRNSAWQESLLDAGEAMVRERSEQKNAAFDRSPLFLSTFRGALKHKALQLVDYIEKDPNYETRLLLED